MYDGHLVAALHPKAPVVTSEARLILADLVKWPDWTYILYITLTLFQPTDYLYSILHNAHTLVPTSVGLKPCHLDYVAPVQVDFNAAAHSLCAICNAVVSLFREDFCLRLIVEQSFFLCMSADRVF